MFAAGKGKSLNMKGRMEDTIWGIINFTFGEVEDIIDECAASDG